MSSWDLFVLDLDGTLLGPGGAISEVNSHALDRLRAAGIDVLVATGRTRNEAAHILSAIDYRGCLIGVCGAVLTEPETGRTLKRRLLPPSLVHEAVGHLHEEGHTTLILKDHHATGYDYLVVGCPEDPAPTLHPVSQWWMESMGISCRWIDRIEDDPDPEHTLRVSVVGEGALLDPASARIRSAFDRRIHMLQWGAVTSSHATGSDVHILELFAPGVDKWSMILEYCNDHGHDPSRVVAIGDGLNDVGMLSSAGLGIAMENADDDVRAAADVVTGHHGADGVAEAIDRLLGATA